MGSGREKGQSILPYGRFITGLEGDLVEALRTMENDGWHHLPRDDERSQVYVRCVTWLVEVDRRKRRWDDHKAQKYGQAIPTAGPDSMAGPADSGDDYGGGRGFSESYADHASESDDQGLEAPADDYSA